MKGAWTAWLFGAPYSLMDVAFNQLPPLGRWLYRTGRKRLFNRLARIKSKRDIRTRWALGNGMHSIGGADAFDFLRMAEAYTLADVEGSITCPVLVIYEERDLFVADGIQEGKFRHAFKNARSYRIEVFKEEDGAVERNFFSFRHIV